MRVVIDLPDQEFKEQLAYARAKGFISQKDQVAVKTLLTFCTNQHMKKYPLSAAQRREVEKKYGMQGENPTA